MLRCQLCQLCPSIVRRRWTKRKRVCLWKWTLEEKIYVHSRSQPKKCWPSLNYMQYAKTCFDYVSRLTRRATQLVDVVKCSYGPKTRSWSLARTSRKHVATTILWIERKSNRFEIRDGVIMSQRCERSVENYYYLWILSFIEKHVDFVIKNRSVHEIIWN